MDHDYELANTDRYKNDILTLDTLLKPASYYASIRPLNFGREESIRVDKAAAKASKPAATEQTSTN
jgi:NADH-quinone oxidoreductase subunit I